MAACFSLNALDAPNHRPEDFRVHDPGLHSCGEDDRLVDEPCRNSALSSQAVERDLDFRSHVYLLTASARSDERAVDADPFRREVLAQLSRPRLPARQR